MNGPSPTQHERRYAGVLATHRDQIVLVREEYPTWGGTYWNIPSGRVEPIEGPAEGASRELAEETGLVAPPETLALHSTSSVTGPGVLTRAWNFTVDIQRPTAISVEDPDGLIQDAQWFTIAKAVRLLRELPYQPLSEPALAILERHVEAGLHWTYSHPSSRPVLTRHTPR